MTIKTRALHRNKKIPGPYPARIVADAGYLSINRTIY
jgi:hypothetical protein